MKNLPEKNTFLVKKTYGLKSVAFIIIALLLISYGLIGGCNNDSGSGQSQNADALVIGSLDGVIVPALNDVAVLKKWSQGDADNNFILNGNRVNQLTTNQKAAPNPDTNSDNAAVYNEFRLSCGAGMCYGPKSGHMCPSTV